MTSPEEEGTMRNMAHTGQEAKFKTWHWFLQTHVLLFTPCGLSLLGKYGVGVTVLQTSLGLPYARVQSSKMAASPAMNSTNK